MRREAGKWLREFLERMGDIENEGRRGVNTICKTGATVQALEPTLR